MVSLSQIYSKHGRVQEFQETSLGLAIMHNIFLFMLPNKTQYK